MTKRGLHALERLPNPVVVAVDVDREEVDVAGEAGLREDVVDVLACHEGADEDRRPHHRVGVPGVEAAARARCSDSPASTNSPSKPRLRARLAVLLANTQSPAPMSTKRRVGEPPTASRNSAMPSSSNSEKTRKPVSHAGRQRFAGEQRAPILELKPAQADLGGRRRPAALVDQVQQATERVAREIAREGLETGRHRAVLARPPTSVRQAAATRTTALGVATSPGGVQNPYQGCPVPQLGHVTQVVTAAVKLCPQ